MPRNKTVTVHHPALGVSRSVPDNPRTLAVLARSGWQPETKAKAKTGTDAKGDKTSS